MRAPNVAREVSLLPQLLPSVPAYTLNRACASAAQAITNAADSTSNAADKAGDAAEGATK